MLTWLLAFLLQEIIDNYLAPQHANAGEVQDARVLLKDYWAGLDQPDQSKLQIGQLINQGGKR